MRWLSEGDSFAFWIRRPTQAPNLEDPRDMSFAYQIFTVTPDLETPRVRPLPEVAPYAQRTRGGDHSAPCLQLPVVQLAPPEGLGPPQPYSETQASHSEDEYRIHPCTRCTFLS